MKNRKVKIHIPKNIVVLVSVAAVLALLKVSGVIGWSWWLVLAPAWVPFALIFLIVVAVVVVMLVKDLEVQARHYMNRKARSENIDNLAAEYGLERRPGESNADLMKRVAFMKQVERRERRANYRTEGGNGNDEE